jgi:hypothetical protein
MNWYDEMPSRVTEQNAIALTIEKFKRVLWRRMGLSLSISDCPLCAIYYEPGCEFCPVFKTYEHLCYALPEYQEMERLNKYHPPNWRADRDIIIREKIIPALQEMQNGQNQTG